MEPNLIGIITGVISVIASIGAVLLREAFSKGKDQNRLNSLEKWREKKDELYEHQKKADFEYNKAQDSRISRNTEDIIRMRENILTTREAQEKLYQEMRDDRRENQKIIAELSKTMAGFDATLKGLSNIMQQIDSDIRNGKLRG